MKKIFAFQKDKNRLKLLLFHINGEKVFIEDYQKHELENGDKSAEFIKQFISNNKAASFKTICFLSLSSIYVRKITFPYKRISKIRKSIRFAVEPHIPIPVENTKVFFHPVHTKNNSPASSPANRLRAGFAAGGLEVMAFIIPEDILKEQLELINSAQLICNEIYLTPLSLFNFFNSHIQINENTLWLDVEENSTYIFYILKDGKLADLKELPVGREHISEEKEQLKREISTVLLSQSLESSESKITEIYISGLPASARQAGLTESQQATPPEICDWLAKNFNIPMKSIEFDNLLFVEQPAQPAGSEANGKNSDFIPEILYASLTRGGPLSINFHPPVLQEKEKRGILVSCSLIIFALLAISFRLQFERSIYEKKFNSLNSQIEKIFLQTFPEAKDTRTPLLQMKSRIKSLKGSASSSSLYSGFISPLGALREISQRLDKALQIELNTFRLKDENAIISGNVPSYQDIDKIKSALENSQLFSKVDIESAQTTAKGVDFRLKVHPVRD